MPANTRMATDNSIVIVVNEYRTQQPKSGGKPHCEWKSMTKSDDGKSRHTFPTAVAALLE